MIFRQNTSISKSIANILIYKNLLNCENHDFQENTQISNPKQLCFYMEKGAKIIEHGFQDASFVSEACKAFRKYYDFYERANV